MIHYICDCCKCRIDHENDMRYVVRLEIYASLDPMEGEVDDDRDHLQEIQDMLECIDEDEDVGVADDVYQHARYDLCSECRKRFVQNPLGRLASAHLDFSQN